MSKLNVTKANKYRVQSSGYQRWRGWGEMGKGDWLYGDRWEAILCWWAHCREYRNRNRILYEVNMKVAQSCLTLCDPLDYTAHGILQARTLEWVAFPSSRGSSQPRDRTQVSYIAGGFFTNWATREAQNIESYIML